MVTVIRRRSLVLAALLLATFASAASVVAQRSGSAPLPQVVVYKDANCGCCSLWIEHLQKAGFPVRWVNSTEMAAIKTKHRVPATLGSCHTAVVDGFVVEGHVPADDVKRLLTSRPKVLGIAVPGMPIGSPGMEQGSRKQSYAVMSFDATGKTAIFAEH
jgi:hypothetical protein